MKPLDAAAIAELLTKYDRPGPRYTSYPTAVEFTEDLDSDAYDTHLANASKVDAPLSLYFHLPFCSHRCSFCGCNVVITNKHHISQRYLETLHQEIDLVADKLGNRTRVLQLHWGGGTPTYQTVPEMRALFEKIVSRFQLEEGAEIAIEVDPRVTTKEQLELLRELGFNRLSMGVQDFTQEVQEAILRNQTEEETFRLTEQCRELGFESLNLDLIYGLPKQTPESFQVNLDKVLELRPERLAVYSYAHVPWLAANQRKTDTDYLPSAAVKLHLFGMAREAFVAAGYDPIGMDHFALPEDELATAAKAGKLHRNFMGYTTRPAPDMVGFGTSAIGDVDFAYVQNVKILPEYRRQVEAGVLPVLRGVRLTDDDRLRREVIQSLMCNWRVDRKMIEEKYGVDFAETFAIELDALREAEMDGFATITDDAIEVVGHGRLIVRNIAMVFDERLRRMNPDRPVFSRTI